MYVNAMPSPYSVRWLKPPLPHSVGQTPCAAKPAKLRCKASQQRHIRLNHWISPEIPPRVNRLPRAGCVAGTREWWLLATSSQVLPLNTEITVPVVRTACLAQRKPERNAVELGATKGAPSREPLRMPIFTEPSPWPSCGTGSPSHATRHPRSRGPRASCPRR